MTETKNAKSFSERFDADEKLISRGKALTTVSIVLLAIEVSGAVMKETNTFIFKIEFTHQVGITYLLLAAVIYLTIRYRNYAKPYHHELFLLWSERMMEDKEVFHYSHRDEMVTGLLGHAIDVCGIDEPGIQSVSYKVSGFLRRGVTYPTVWHGENGYDELTEYYDEYLSLFKFNDSWTRTKYIYLLLTEFKYRSSAFLDDREHLDLLSPYMFSVIAIISALIPWAVFI